METCVFCKIIKGELPSYTIYEDDVVKAFLSIEPIGNGHLLIIPKKHFVNICDIDIDVLHHINTVSKSMYKPLMYEFIHMNNDKKEIVSYESNSDVGTLYYMEDSNLKYIGSTIIHDNSISIKFSDGNNNVLSSIGQFVLQNCVCPTKGRGTTGTLTTNVSTNVEVKSVKKAE